MRSGEFIGLVQEEQIVVAIAIRETQQPAFWNKGVLNCSDFCL